MRTTADDDNTNEGSSASTSCVVDSKIEKESNEPVGVNNCVNINSNSFDDAPSASDDNLLISDHSVVKSPIYECTAAELDGDDGEAAMMMPSDDDDDARRKKIDEEILNKFLFNDDDALTSSKYSDVTSRCELLQPSTSSTATATAQANVVDDDVVVVSSSIPQYKATRDNNRNHRKAVRKNFSLWIGVTSCVWGLLLLLMKNYAD
jgi:hypothetical protein